MTTTTIFQLKTENLRIVCILVKRRMSSLYRDRREFATASGECMPCHPECKAQTGRETCTGPVWDPEPKLGVLLPPRGSTMTRLTLLL